MKEIKHDDVLEEETAYFRILGGKVVVRDYEVFQQVQRSMAHKQRESSLESDGFEKIAELM